MIIRYKKHAATAEEAKNTFEAYDDLENRLGEAVVKECCCPYVWRDRPRIVTIALEGDRNAADALLGAATAHAMRMAWESGERACIRLDTLPGDDRFCSMLEALGYGGQSALVRMEAQLRPGPITVPIPAGMTVLRDYLNDEQEKDFYLERVNALFDEGLNREWLEETRSKPFFTRILLIDEHGAAGEMITWAEDDCAVADRIWVHPESRRKGAGKFMLEFARIYWLECRLKSARMDVWNRLQPAMRLAYASGFQQTRTIAEYPYMDV